MVQHLSHKTGSENELQPNDDDDGDEDDDDDGKSFIMMVKRFTKTDL